MSKTKKSVYCVGHCSSEVDIAMSYEATEAQVQIPPETLHLQKIVINSKKLNQTLFLMRLGKQEYWEKKTLRAE